MTSLQRKGPIAAVILAAAIFCTGCGSSTIGAGFPIGLPNSNSIPTQISTFFTDERLPVIPQAVASECAALLPEQPVCNDDTGRILAYQITQYCDSDGIAMPEFGNGVPVDYSSALKTALYHTGPILLPVEYSTETGEYICPTYPDHRLFQLFLQQSEPCEFLYQDDVIKKASELFGDDLFYSAQQNISLSPFSYYPEEKVFMRPVEASDDTIPCPVILSYSERENKISVSALMGETQGSGCPITVGGIVCTTENTESLKSQNPLYHFTFEQQADGRLVLKGYQMMSFVSKEI